MSGSIHSTRPKGHYDRTLSSVIPRSILYTTTPLEPCDSFLRFLALGTIRYNVIKIDDIIIDIYNYTTFDYTITKIV